MKIARDKATGNRQMSIYNDRFLDFVENNPSALEPSSFNTGFYYEKEHSLQPWPTFVSPETEKQFRYAGENIFNLIKSIPKRIFNNDTKKIADYFRVTRSLVEIQLSGVTEKHLQNLMARGDFAWTESGLKCFEYNVSANIGGFSVPMWIAGYMNSPLIKKFLEENNITIRNKHLVRQLLEHILKVIVDSRDCGLKNVNILMATSSGKFSGPVGDDFNQLYQDVLTNHDLPIKGEAFVAAYKELELVDNHIYYNGECISAIIETQHGMVSPGVLNAFKAGNLKLINGPVTPLLSSKLILALLSDYNGVSENTFNDEEKQIIDSYIPWSRKITPGLTHYQGESIMMEQLIMQEKDRFVIKPSIGYGGIDVNIGRNTETGQWKLLVDKALKQKNWLVQEFVETQPAIYLTHDQGAQPHYIGLGLFLLGEHYAGSWARVLPTSGQKGIINTHQGAKVCIVFEVDK